MRRIARVLLGVAVLTGTAGAKAPTLEQLPTVKRVIEEAEAAARAAAEAAAERARDPKQELIAAYADGTVNVHSWQKIVDILRDDKEKDEYRSGAAEAIVKRFTPLKGDARYEAVRKKIAEKLVRDLNDKRLQVRLMVARIFKTFWEGRYDAIGYDPNEVSFRERFNKIRDWQKFLRGR